MKTAGALVAGAAVFVLLATANVGGYRYGVSDQAFYVPAVLEAANPDLFPRDDDMLAIQAKLMASDDLLAKASHLVSGDLPGLFLAGYLFTLVLLFSAAIAFARTLRLSWWATAACVLLLTLRHRIAETGANSLEGYLHPRQLAFAIGVWAWVLLLRGRPIWALVVTAAAGLVHPTTALWFGASIAVGAAVRHRELRPWLAGAALVLAGGAAWALVAGPLAGRLAVMDGEWLAVLSSKDYLFPADWPLYAWLLNLAYVPVIALLYRKRRDADAATEGEQALVAGLFALVVLFIVSVPGTEAHIALAVQLQVNRVFWLLDFVVAAYLAWWFTSWRQGRAAVVVVAVLAALSAGRGVYLLTVSHAERDLFAPALPETPWIEAMTWLRTQPNRWHVLADPEHGWRYGISVRVAAERDTLLETSKDSAIAIYDRDIARRVADRMSALANFAHLTREDLLSLDIRYDLDVAVLEGGRRLDLPVLYRNSQFVIYDLR